MVNYTGSNQVEIPMVYFYFYLFFFLQVGFKVFYIQRNGQYKGSQIVRNFPDCRACRANKVCSKISHLYTCIQ